MPNEIFDQTPWSTLILFESLSQQLKETHPLPDYVSRIANGTADYETQIRIYWDKFKSNPSIANAKLFIEALVEYAKSSWKEFMADVLGVDSDDLSLAQLDLLERKITEHIDFMSKSLLPDILHAIEMGLDDFSSFDYRVIFLYAGALWSFGFLATIMFDGVELRDAGDLFMFLGPDDDATCEGPRGCKQHVGQTYTVAEILAFEIIPGRLKCLTSCRHILIPFMSM